MVEDVHRIENLQNHTSSYGYGSGFANQWSVTYFVNLYFDKMVLNNGR